MKSLFQLTERPTFPNPWAEFERIRQSFDDLSRGLYAQKHKATVFPPLNIYEANNQLVVTAELPGVAPDEVEISFEGDTLTIKGKRSTSKDSEGRSYHRRELQGGNFSRAITLPVQISPEHITATLKEGILTLTLPKAATAKTHAITVNAE